jgi:hypothetical protein
MKRFRRFFALLFILSLFMGVIHEISHVHHQGDVCEICVLSHAPGLLGDTSILLFIDQIYEPFIIFHLTLPAAPSILTRSRAPPLS